MAIDGPKFYRHLFPSPVTTMEVIRQAVSDWFGKEVQNGYTYSYVWMANQLGHFTLGFLFSYIIYWIWEWTSGPIDPLGWVLVVPIGQFLFWTIKEVRDYFIAVNEAPGFFPVDRRGIAWNATTAVFFITCGIIVAYVALWGPWEAFISFVILFIICLWPAYYWLRQKTVYQRAVYPFFFRLADFQKNFNDEDRDELMRFMNLEGDWQHVLIVGRGGTGKSTLGVGIGTEFSLRLGVGRYLTFFKLLQFATARVDPTRLEGNIVWPWRDAKILIVDDVDPGIRNTPIDPAEIERTLKDLPKEELAVLAGQRVVWILGLPLDTESWRERFHEIFGIEKDKIGVVRLSPTDIKPRRKPISARRA